MRYFDWLTMAEPVREPEERPSIAERPTECERVPAVDHNSPLTVAELLVMVAVWLVCDAINLYVVWRFIAAADGSQMEKGAAFLVLGGIAAILGPITLAFIAFIYLIYLLVAGVSYLF